MRHSKKFRSQDMNAIANCETSRHPDGRHNLRSMASPFLFVLVAVASLFVWQRAAQMREKKDDASQRVQQSSLRASSLSTALTPILGNYPPTTVSNGANAVVPSDAVPQGLTRINVSTDSNFKGTFVADLVSGDVRVTNAHPAGTYMVTVKALDNNSSASTTFPLTVMSGTQCRGSVQFGNGTNVSTDVNPLSVAVGDFNKDGNQDIATANGNSTVSIRLGNGSGGFIGSTNVGVGTFPRAVAIGDFNNDGNQDFATANQLANTVSIRLGDGMGGFSGTANIAVGDQPLSVAIGDFNNDGKRDFATANTGSVTVSIRLGNGLGGFSARSDVMVGSSPISIVVGDFNSDGIQDLAIANIDSNDVSIRWVTGQGNFSALQVSA